MSAKYDLYETPDVQNTGEQQPLHARIVPSGTYSCLLYTSDAADE